VSLLLLSSTIKRLERGRWGSYSLGSHPMESHYNGFTLLIMTADLVTQSLTTKLLLKNHQDVGFLDLICIVQSEVVQNERYIHFIQIIYIGYDCLGRQILLVYRIFS
jgi:hypothetical protein